jgi:two-component system chemotaxis sensor kinase CheA
MDQLLREFLADADDLIEALFADIEALREKREAGRARRALTAQIFRRVHTIKGTAGAAGLETLSQIAHELETLLDGVRLGRVSLSEPVLDAFEDAAQALSHALAAAARGESSHLPIELLETLRRLAASNSSDEGQHASHHGSEAASIPTATPSSTSASAATATPALLPEEIAGFLGADDTRRVHEATAEGQRLFLLHVCFGLEDFDVRFRELSAALGQLGELISTLPGANEAAPGSINLRLLISAEMSAEELGSQVAPFASVSTEELKHEAANRSVSSSALLEREADVAPSDEASTPDASSGPAIAPPATHIRVELGKLDALIAAAHELRTKAGAALNLALENVAAGALRDDLEAHAQRIGKYFVELEKQLIGLRRVRLAETLERAARVGRQAARAVGKDVAFEIVGGEVLLDKSLVEAISDPLLHLVRNAVSHGVETSEERIEAGKTGRGTVRLEALAEDQRVILNIMDDGRGLDLESIARAAVRRGHIEAGRAVTPQQALRLIFSPGFSTARAVSQMAGRGVGLDVVERAVEQLGGEMRVRSDVGTGTTFGMVVPVALALISALVVSSAGESYCVDAGHVVDARLFAPEDVSRVGDEEALDWQGRKLPFVRLRRLLGQPSAEEEVGKRHVVIVSEVKGGAEANAGAGGHAYAAVQVDGWNEERAEVLVRRLGAHAAYWQGVSGAAELADGRLALVLDVPRLLEPSSAVR